MTSRKRKRERGRERLSELRDLARSAGFRLEEFSAIHCRVFGSSVVDYWPTTGRAWVTGSKEPAEKVTPQEVIEWAGGMRIPLPEGAEEHLRSIQ
jgi:hypothetical protein